MDDRAIADILAQQADSLIERQHATEGLALESAEQVESLTALMDLAERVQAALTPVEPDPVFVNRLSTLLATRMIEGTREMSRRGRRATLIIAAALGSVVSLISAIGVIIYLVRQRGRRAQAECPSET